MRVTCESCGKTEQYAFTNWRCECGGAWFLESNLPLSMDAVHKDINSIWRYRDYFPAEIQEMNRSMGAGFTPLLPCRLYDRDVNLKLDYLMPTGSFKDRGVELMLNAMAAERIDRVVEDSSGNAGASVAAYAARMGIQASIFAPAHASPAKLAQIALYGADIHKIPGPRMNATNAVLQAVDQGMIYASHAYNPIYLLGQQTVAWEIWEQLHYQIPDWVVVPVGQGGNLLGYFEGFNALHNSGLIDSIPGLIAVQPARLAPICDAFEQGWQAWSPVGVPKEDSLAEGLAITSPLRWKHILHALSHSGGFCVKVAEETILSAQRYIAQKGFFVEPTSAVVIAALPDIFKIIEREQSVVISLTGSGLKSMSVGL